VLCPNMQAHFSTSCALMIIVLASISTGNSCVRHAASFPHCHVDMIPSPDHVRAGKGGAGPVASETSPAGFLLQHTTTAHPSSLLNKGGQKGSAVQRNVTAASPASPAHTRSNPAADPVPANARWIGRCGKRLPDIVRFVLFHCVVSVCFEAFGTC
jgi:hypothetical protein